MKDGVAASQAERPDKAVAQTDRFGSVMVAGAELGVARLALLAPARTLSKHGCGVADWQQEADLKGLAR